MLSRKELSKRVSLRRQELERDKLRLTELSGKLTAFVKDVQSRSVIYNLIKNLPLWRELEQLPSPDDDSTE